MLPGSTSAGSSPPLLTVITVVRNDVSRLRRTLETAADVLRDGRIEWLVYDGGSTDGSVDVAEVASRKHPRMRLVLGRDSGIYDGMNHAAMFAIGRFVQFTNCGDELVNSEDELSGLLDVLTNGTHRWAIGAVELAEGTSEGRGRRIVDGSTYRQYMHLLGRQAYCHQGIFVEKEILLVSGGFRLDLGVAADFDLIARLGYLFPPVLYQRTIARYEGGGASAGDAMIPMHKHTVRAESLGLNGVMLRLSLAYAFYQKAGYTRPSRFPRLVSAFTAFVANGRGMSDG